MGFVVPPVRDAAVASTCGVRPPLQGGRARTGFHKQLWRIIRVSRVIRSLDNMAREHTERAVETITGVMNDPFAEDRDRLAAANAILDRGHGKPLTAIISLPQSRQQAILLAGMTDDDLEALVQDTPLPRLTKATTIEHHQPAISFDRDPLLD